MRTRLILLVVAALVATACGSGLGGDDTTTSPPTTAIPTTVTTEATTTTGETGESEETTTTITEQGISVDLTTCEDAGDFAILCEAYDLVKSQYVDPLDDAILAAGATQGIADFLDATAGSSGVTEFACPLPSDAFAATCEAAAGALAQFETTGVSVAEAAVIGLFEHGIGDPNSRYLPIDVVERTREEQSGTISGIGSLVVTEELDENGDTIRCNVITESCQMYVVSVIEGGPAEAAGVLAGDVMVSVDGESIVGWTSEEIVAAVRGPAGEPVTIELERNGELLEFTIVRAPILVPVTSSEILDGGVGYVELTQFTNNAGGLFRAELQDLIDQGATQLIVDFRNNPGGALNTAIDVASEFLDDGLVLITQSPDEENTYAIESGGVATSDSLEIVVLVNRGSASASEVVAGVLQETGRATIIGEPTFGKNTVQQQYGLSNGGAIKVTIARWITPAGADFGGDGIIPDILVEVTPGEPTDVLIQEALAFFGVVG